MIEPTEGKSLELGTKPGRERHISRIMVPNAGLDGKQNGESKQAGNVIKLVEDKQSWQRKQQHADNEERQTTTQHVQCSLNQTQRKNLVETGVGKVTILMNSKSVRNILQAIRLVETEPKGRKIRYGAVMEEKTLARHTALPCELSWGRYLDSQTGPFRRF